nr:VWA domain-containing protein [Paenactinomyces guangxiensis]
MKKLAVIATVALTFFATGCGLIGAFDKENQTPKAQPAKKEEKPKPGIPEDPLKPVKENLDYILHQPAGKFSGDKYDKQSVIAELSKTSLNAKEKDNFYNLVKLVGEDYSKYTDFFKNFNTSAPAPTPTPTLTVNGQVVSRKLNIEILLDASGSMNEKIGSQTKMDLAKQSIHSFLSQIPKDANVMLRVYGNKGSNSDADKAVSCRSSEVIYPLKSYDSASFASKMKKVQPSGWTPLARAIQQAQTDLASQKDAQNIVYIVSDGNETCDGDPVAAASALSQSEIRGIVNIIGFDVDDAGQKALKEVAEAGNGTYTTVESEQDLDGYFESQKDRLYNAWDTWYNHNWEQADKYYNEGWEALDQAYNEMWNKADKEYNRMWEVCDETPGCGAEVKSWLDDRSALIKEYADDVSTRLKEELNKNTTKAKNEYDDRATKEKQKILN